MKVWITRDSDSQGTPALWFKKPIKPDKIWSGSESLSAIRHGLICSQLKRVKAVTGTWHGCRKGGIVELEVMTYRRQSNEHSMDS